jgi:hypothetical protein
MSTATIPFTFRNGFFPGLADFSPNPAYGSVNLTATDGDAGLREAIRIWWNLERITFTPSGTATGGAVVASFSKVFKAPDANDTGTATFTQILGSIVASNTNVTIPATTKEPALRGIIGPGTPTQFSIVSAVNFNQSFDYSILVDDQENGRFDFVVYYNGSQWVLYYKFDFIRVKGGTDLAELIIVNDPEVATGTAGPTGTVNFFGYSLAWNSGYNAFASGSVSGVGLTLSFDEWTA